jgi:hypothetical protein
LEGRGLFRGAAHVLEDGKGHGHLALELIGHAHHRDFSHVRMAGDALLDLACAQAVPGHVDHVIRPPQDEEVAVLVADAPIEGAVDLPARNAAPVGLDEALVVAPHRLHAARGQRPFDDYHALLVGSFQVLPGVLVHELDVIAVHRLAR